MDSEDYIAGKSENRNCWYKITVIYTATWEISAIWLA